ncbi:hypothetical protein Tco_1309995 [Tanacetum coccineum]
MVTIRGAPCLRLCPLEKASVAIGRVGHEGSLQSCGTRVPCGVAELTFLARLVLLAKWWNLCSLPVLGFPSGPGSPIRRIVLYVIMSPQSSVSYALAEDVSRLRSGLILCSPFSRIMVRHTIDTVTSVLTQRELDHFCNTYNIPANLGPELPGREDTIRDAPINFSQLSVLGAAKNDHFFWINASICPISVPWHMGASILKDPPPSDDRINAELLALLDHHRTIIRRYPKTFLCLVGLSRSFDDALVRPTLLQDDGSDMGLLDFVKSADPFKVKTGERTLAEGEVPLNNETVNMIVPPSADIIQIVDHTIVDEVKEHAGKKKKRVVFEELPTKRLRSDAAPASEVVPTTGGKSPTALKRLELQSELGGVGSSSVPPLVEEFVSSSVTPTPEPNAYEGSSSCQDGGVWTHRASMGIVVSSSSGPDDEVAAPMTVETATADNIYVLEWGVTNGTRVDNAALCRNLLDHITPPGYWAMLRNLEKFQKKFDDTYVVVQHCNAEITVLRTRLEKAEHEAAKVVSLRGRVSELEAGVAVKSQEVGTLGGDCERLRKEVVGEAKLREEFKSFQDAEASCFEQKSAELDAHIADVRRDMDDDLYPHMFTAIAGRRCLLSHAVNKGIQEGLEAGVEHGRSGRTLAQLELLKDSPLASIMSALVLKDAHGYPYCSCGCGKEGLCPPPLAEASGSVPLPGSSIGVVDYQVLSDDGGSTTQPPIV